MKNKMRIFVKCMQTLCLSLVLVIGILPAYLFTTTECVEATTQQYKLYYNVSGGDALDPEYVMLDDGAEFGELPIPTRTGYTFAGWYSSNTYSSEVFSYTKISNNTAIYAKWVDNVAAVNVSGTLDTGVTWSLNTDGELRISGTADMTNFANAADRPWNAYCTAITSIVIEDGVQSIGKYAFWGCYNVRSVSIPNSVLSVGYRSFAYCTNLETISIPNSVTTILDGAFWKCSSLKNIQLPSGLTTINKLFENCTSLESINIPSTVSTISSYAFYGCTSLTEVIIPNGVTAINESTFQYCTSLNHVVIPSSVTAVSMWAFYKCHKLKTARPITQGGNTNGVIEYGWTTTIPSFAFYFTEIEAIEFPSALQTIGSNAFRGCEKLVDVEFSGSLTEIQGRAFAECSSIVTICLPDGVTTIGYDAFFGCTSLVSINIPDSVTSIGSRAFCKCTSLMKLVVPSTTTSIGSNAYGYSSPSIDSGSVTSVAGQTIYAKVGSAAETFATGNSVNFVASTRYGKRNGSKYFEVSVSETISCGTPTRFYFNAYGGSGNQYKYRVYSITTESGDFVYDVSYGSNSAYSTNDYFDFTFYASGTYYVRFSAMDLGETPYTTISTNLYQIKLVINDSNYPSVSERVASIVADCEAAGCTTDYEKAVWLNDWLVDHCTYDSSMSYCSEEGALARGTGTCEAYTRAYSMLLSAVGIENARAEIQGDHCWNLVKLNGDWYHVDVTWNDAGYTQSGYDLKHMYFGLTDEIMTSVHPTYVVQSSRQCTELAENYYVVYGGLNSWTADVQTAIQNEINAGKTAFTISTATPLYSNILGEIIEYELNQNEWKKNGKTVDVSVSFVANANLQGGTYSVSVSERESETLSIEGICYIFNENDISIGCACTSNVTGVTYRWLSYNLDTGSWETISDWSGSNWSSWKPKAGNYWLQVQARTPNGTTAYYTICFVSQKDYTAEKLTLDGFCYIFQNDRIDIGTAYTTNASGVQFKWTAYNLDTGVWSDISDWSTGNWTSWRPAAGNYWVVVQAKTPSGRVVQNVLCFAVDRNYGPQLNLNGICYIQQTDRIDVGVAYDCTNPNVEFQWMAYNLDTQTWSVIADWNGSNWASWRPVQGNYWLMAQARMSDGTVKSYTICYYANRSY